MIGAAPLTPVRVVGLVFAAGLFVSALLRYRRRTISRLNLIITSAVTLAMAALAISPAFFQPLFDLLRFRPGNQRQLIAALLFAVFVLLALILRATSIADANAASVRQLVEALAVQSVEAPAERERAAGDRVAVVIPAYNEAQNIAGVLEAVPATLDGLPVQTVVVDDASDDATARVAQDRGATVVRLPIRRGQGMALRVGYEAALRLGAKAVVSIDADGQHDPADLGVVLAPVLAGDADMVVGSRRLGEFERESRVRHAGMYLLSTVVSLLHRVRITDVSSGFRAVSADLIRRLELEQDQYSSEILVEALRHRARIVEVPISVRARASGVSKKPSSLRYGFRFTKVILQTWLR